MSQDISIGLKGQIKELRIWREALDPSSLKEASALQVEAPASGGLKPMNGIWITGLQSDWKNYVRIEVADGIANSRSCLVILFVC